MQVPQTPTATDKFEEVRKLNGDIAVLKGVKEIKDRETKIAVEAATLAREAIGKLTKELADMTALVPATALETAEFVRFCEKVVRESWEVAENSIQWSEKVMAEAATATQQLEDVRKEKDRVHQAIVDETLILDRQRDDLNIYHARLKRHFEKYMPGQVLTI